MTATEDLRPSDLAELAGDLARSAGRLVLDLQTAAVADATTKSSPTDLVTTADEAAERHIVDGILAARPNDGVRGEEGAERTGSSDVVWHIDPIDGTTNYVYGIPAFSVSIAAEVGGQVVAGAVYHPSRDRLYQGALGAGATVDDRPLRCSPLTDPALALVATGFGYDADRRRDQARVVGDLIAEVRDIRRIGSAALDLCAVAAGEVDAYYERGLNLWDLAAGAVIAMEAGAMVGDLRGGPPGPGFLLAANPTLFDRLRSRLVELDADHGP